jgi:hypothetical protein
MPIKDIIAKKKYNKEYRLKNKERLNAYRRKWSKGEEAQKKKKEYYLKTRERQLKYWVEYRKNPKNKKKFNLYFKKWINNKLKTDPHFKLKQQLSHRIYLALKNKVKSKRTKDLLGCTIEELWIHLEKSFKPGMTKENYGKWHVDHVKPCASFDLTKPEEQAKCFHYTNLQALWAKENIFKSDKYEK